MQRTGKLILKIAVLLLVLFVLPSALYGKDPIAEAIAGYEPKELESDLTIETPEAEAPQGMEQADLSDMLGTKSTNRCRSGSRIFYGGHVSCDGCRRNRGSAGDLPERKKCGKSLLRG